MSSQSLLFRSDHTALSSPTPAQVTNTIQRCPTPPPNTILLHPCTKSNNTPTSLTIARALSPQMCRKRIQHCARRWLCHDTPDCNRKPALHMDSPRRSCSLRDVNQSGVIAWPISCRFTARPPRKHYLTSSLYRRIRYDSTSTPLPLRYKFSLSSHLGFFCSTFF